MNQPDAFMDKAEHLVRKHSRTPRTEHPALENARQAIELEQQARRQETDRLLRAIRLAPTIEICEALLRGESVPRSKLDPEWVKAYGL